VIRAGRGVRLGAERSNIVRHGLTALTMLAALAAAPTGAHHSISAHYHRTQSLTIEGAVTRVQFQNPHAMIYLEARGADSVEHWILEWDDIGDLGRQGISADTVRAGDLITVSGNPARDLPRQIFIRTLHRPADGLRYVDD
jgi:hypothetical protein